MDYVYYTKPYHVVYIAIVTTKAKFFSQCDKSDIFSNVHNLDT